MKLFYGILAVICFVGVLFILLSQAYIMMWGKIVLAFAVGFLASATMKLLISNLCKRFTGESLYCSRKDSK